MEHYHNSISLNTTATTLYNALSLEIPLWWSAQYEGKAQHAGDVFTVRFGDLVHKTIVVSAVSLNSSVTWQVKDSLIAIPDLLNQTEWIGTTIQWNIRSTDSGVILNLTHIGLHPDVECYDICSTGWQQFTNSLKRFVETGVGTPFSL